MTTLRTANMLGALAGAVMGQLERQLKHHPNQTDSSAAALALIAVFEGCSNAALSQALKLSHTATVRLLDKLESQGLIDSRVGQDKRSVALFLTEAGRAKTRSLLEERCAALGGVVELLSAKQQRQLDDILEVLLRGLVTSPLEAAHICRLCDEIVCPHDQCPVHQQAVAMAIAPETSKPRP